MRFLLILVACLGLVVTSCKVTSTNIQTGAIQDSVMTMVHRLDGYLNRDDGLSLVEREQSMQDSTALLAVVSTSTELPRSTIEELLVPVADRHDAYVSADASLSELERRIALRTTSALRTVIEAAPGDGG